MYINSDEIKIIQLDHTSRCNCLCPQCGRVDPITGNINPLLPIADLTVDDYKLILSELDMTNIKLLFCGSFGDVIASPTFDQSYDYCLSRNCKQIKIMTNGSYRPTEWWANLAKKSKEKLIITFDIDGLEDTNHLYRIGSNFNKIIENAKAFIDAGGYAEWTFLKFDHNYHQVDDAMLLAKKLGFKTFTVKSSSRFVDWDQQSLYVNKNNTILVDDKTNHLISEKQNIINKYGNFDEYVNITAINCKYQKLKMIFIGFDMKVWPCCWLGCRPYFDEGEAFEHIISLYGKDFNNLRIHSLNEILSSEFFTTYLKKSWNNPDDIFKRIYFCGEKCGEKYHGTGLDNTNRKSTDLTK